MPDPKCHCPEGLDEITDTERETAQHLGLEPQYVHNMMDEWSKVSYRRLLCMKEERKLKEDPRYYDRCPNGQLPPECTEIDVCEPCWQDENEPPY